MRLILALCLATLSACAQVPAAAPKASAGPQATYAAWSDDQKSADAARHVPVATATADKAAIMLFGDAFECAKGKRAIAIFRDSHTAYLACWSSRPDGKIALDYEDGDHLVIDVDEADAPTKGSL
jgi:hypothetical protein